MHRARLLLRMAWYAPLLLAVMPSRARAVIDADVERWVEALLGALAERDSSRQAVVSEMIEAVCVDCQAKSLLSTGRSLRVARCSARTSSTVAATASSDMPRVARQTWANSRNCAVKPSACASSA